MKNKILKIIYIILISFIILFSIYLLFNPIKKKVQTPNYDTTKKFEYKEIDSQIKQNVYIDNKETVGLLLILNEDILQDNLVVSVFDNKDNLILAKDITEAESPVILLEFESLNVNENYTITILDKDLEKIKYATAKNNNGYIISDEENMIPFVSIHYENDYSFLWYTLFVFAFLFMFYPYVWSVDNNEKK